MECRMKPMTVLAVLPIIVLFAGGATAEPPQTAPAPSRSQSAAPPAPEPPIAPVAGSPPDTAEVRRQAAAAKTKTSQGFVNAITQNIRLQQQASLLAMSKAASEEVRAFAQQTLDEQDRLLKGLKAAAAKQRNVLPQETDALTQAKLDTLRGKQGQHFDQLYTADVNAARDDTIAMLRNATTAPGVSLALKTYARNMLPEMERQAAISTPLTKPK
jgi:putative membrane protein